MHPFSSSEPEIQVSSYDKKCHERHFVCLLSVGLYGLTLGVLKKYFIYSEWFKIQDGHPGHSGLWLTENIFYFLLVTCPKFFFRDTAEMLVLFTGIQIQLKSKM